MSSTSGPNVNENGAIFYVDAANPKSYPGTGNTWNNLTSTDYNATLVNGVTYSNSNQGTMIFDGTDDYVNLGSSNPFVGNNIQTLTTSQWVYSTGDNRVTTISLKRTSNSSVFRTAINEYPQGVTAAGYIGFLTRSNDDTVTGLIASNTVPVKNTWVNLVCVVDGMNRLVYVNGNLIASDSNIGMQPISSTTANATVGAFVYDSNSAVNSPFAGNIATTMIYNRALSADEVTQNFNALRGRYGI